MNVIIDPQPHSIARAFNIGSRKLNVLNEIIMKEKTSFFQLQFRECMRHHLLRINRPFVVICRVLNWILSEGNVE